MSTQEQVRPCISVKDGRIDARGYCSPFASPDAPTLPDGEYFTPCYYTRDPLYGESERTKLDSDRPYSVAEIDLRGQVYLALPAESEPGRRIRYQSG